MLATPGLKTRPAGYILAGGKSSRMGTDKAGLVAGGRTLLDRIVGELAVVCCSVAVVGGTAAPRGIPIIGDAMENSGPAAGILSALRIGEKWNLVVACDMPGVTREVFDLLVHHSLPNETDCIVPIGPDGRQHPLCGLYHARCLPGWELAMAEGMRAVRAIITRFRVTNVLIRDSELLSNVNTPAEWQDYLAHVR